MSQERARQLYEVMYDTELSMKERNELLKVFVLDPDYEAVLLLAREIYKQEGRPQK